MEQTKISAKVIADSISEFGNRITTMELVFPRFILAELNTHRAFSRNSASSRAIPFNKMVKSVEDNPFIPIAWQKEHKGMQGTEYFEEEKNISWFKMNYLKARNQAVERANDANEKGLTKQLCNRLLEPFMWHKVLLTSTSFENFFELRCPKYLHEANGKYYKSIKEWNLVDKDIQITDTITALKINEGQSEIHMMALAEAMYDALNESTPELLTLWKWHLPYSNDIVASIEDLIKICVAKCARVSYTTVGENKESNYENDIKLYDKLLKSGHWSPFEHCAMCQEDKPFDNFNGFQSFRNSINF